MSEQPVEPTWMDWYELKLWLWAFLEDAHAFLDASQKRNAVNAPPPTAPSRLWTERLTATARFDLRKYHFVMTMGTLVKTLTRVSPLFPSVQALFEKAEHLREEGAYLRNMIEHADRNIAAQKRGTPRGGFVRKSSLLPEIPGSSAGAADATSVVIDQKGHWLGGRFNVERAIVEVRAMYDAAAAIPPPAPKWPPPPTPSPDNSREAAAQSEASKVSTIASIEVRSGGNRAYRDCLGTG